MTAKYDWVVWKYDVSPNELWCNRCGEKQVCPEGSMNIDLFIAFGNAFLKLHKKCKLKG